MLETGMYVRCPYDHEDVKNPRIFFTGKIFCIDEFAETIQVEFYDPFGYRSIYTDTPKGIINFPIIQLQRCKLQRDSIIDYAGKLHTIVEIEKTKQSNWYYYYIESKEKEIFKVCEKELIVPFTVGHVLPSLQLANYEFQNPCWYFGRHVVAKTVHVLKNSIFGLKQLAGCKIFLMPHQIHTIMRCLKEEFCRYMIADEVGLGKTIEACSILKIYISQNAEKDILIIVPDSILEQWRTEMFAKFNLVENFNENGNRLTIISIEQIKQLGVLKKWDFIIVDEVHRFLTNGLYFEIQELSLKTDNILLLSATPVQQKKLEYLKLLRLVLPERYDRMSENEFSDLMDKQRKISKRAYIILDDLESYQDEINEKCEGLDIKGEDISLLKDDKDLKDLFEELDEAFAELGGVINNCVFNEFLEKIDYQVEDLGVSSMQIAISYVCENYQIEKSIIRSRRGSMPFAKRTFVELAYDLDIDVFTYEVNTYRLLEEWIESLSLDRESFQNDFIPLLGAFFSSSWAFYDILKKKIYKTLYQVNDNIIDFAERWIKEEEALIDDIQKTLENPELLNKRIIKIIDFIDQEIMDRKVVIFTNFLETFRVYEQCLSDYFGLEKCAFFNKNMTKEDLEINVYRFQSEKDCTILLCDSTGGEGRNFQNADYIVHIDLPWDANLIEQRIGRLDRIGRDLERDVISVVAYGRDTLEEQLFKFWNEGLHLFESSLSGLEIIMNEINESIIRAILKNFKYGLEETIEAIIKITQKMKKTIREEQFYDIAAYKYQTLNRELDKAINYYNENENELFATTMLRWASLTGLKGHIDTQKETIKFNDSSFSVNSAKNTLLIPPDWEAYMKNSRKNYISRISELYENRHRENNPRRSSTRYIEGTFNRSKAIENDLLNFFAPGDAIYDCITENAINSARGQVTAFVVNSVLNWKGLVFTWSVRPDINILLEHEISLNALNQFRNYLTVDQVLTSYPMKSTFEIEESMILKEFNRILDEGFIKEKIEHLGRRQSNCNLLKKIKPKGLSNIEWFKKNVPEEQWSLFVDIAEKSAKEKAIQKFISKSKINSAKTEIKKMIETSLTLNDFYSHRTTDSAKMKKLGELLYKSLSNPKIEQESIAFVWMGKFDENN